MSAVLCALSPSSLCCPCSPSPGPSLCTLLSLARSRCSRPKRREPLLRLLSIQSRPPQNASSPRCFSLLAHSSSSPPRARRSFRFLPLSVFHAPSPFFLVRSSPLTRWCLPWSRAVVEPFGLLDSRRLFLRPSHIQSLGCDLTHFCRSSLIDRMRSSSLEPTSFRARAPAPMHRSIRHRSRTGCELSKAIRMGCVSRVSM